MFAFIWTGAVNDDWTAGDCVIVAQDLEQAYALFDARMGMPIEDAFDVDGRMVGSANIRHQYGYVFHPRKQEPEYVIPLYAGMVYCGNGGG